METILDEQRIADGIRRLRELGANVHLDVGTQFAYVNAARIMSEACLEFPNTPDPEPPEPDEAPTPGPPMDPGKKPF